MADRGREIKSTEKIRNNPGSREPSQERRDREIKQMEERREIAAKIDREKMGNNGKKEQNDGDIINPEYEKLIRKVENLAPYDYKAATENFNKRYDFEIEPLSKSLMIRVWPKGYQDIIDQGKAHRSELYMNYIDLEKKDLEIMETYRTEDDNIKVEGTYALHTDEILWQTCRLATEYKGNKVKISINGFKPERLRVSSISEPDTVEKVNSLDTMKDKPITKEMQEDYEKIMSSKIGKIGYFFFNRFYESKIAEIAVDKGKNQNRIGSLDFSREKTT